MDDFKALLQAEIEEKKKLLRQNTLEKDSKYVKRADLGRMELEKLEMKQKELDEQRAQKRSKLVKGELNEPLVEVKGKSWEEGLSTSLNEQVENALLANSQPARLEGESDLDRAKRLKSLNLKDIHYGEGSDLIGFVSGLVSEDRPAIAQVTNGISQSCTDPLTRGHEDNDLDAMKTDPISIDALKSKDTTKLRSLITIFLKRLLREQDKMLANRSEEECKSREGKMATIINVQMQEHLKPLFKKLKKNSLEQDIFLRITEICSFLQQREYIQANDAYLKMAIGNAPWPIGVTAVGIHERSAQERIATSQVAHVLNDEDTRKWLQAVKRLMTFCQRQYPSTDRAKMMG